jgi:RNA polymerase sigma-70 factor (ECF subfamily)
MLAASSQAEPPSAAKWFATTHWSVVLNAADSLSPNSDSALEALCRAYWYPLYAYVRRRGYDVESARELTQEFFAQLLAKKLLHAVDPTKGRFRSWLLGVMKHFLAHEWVRAHAQKRGAGQPTFSLDELEAETRYCLEPADFADPEKIFDRRWAFTVLERAAGKLRLEYESAGKTALFNTLKEFVSAEGTSLSYEDCAARLSLSVSAVKSAIHRLRQRYQELIRDEIAQTVTTLSEIDEEIRYLLAVIRG